MSARGGPKALLNSKPPETRSLNTTFASSSSVTDRQFRSMYQTSGLQIQQDLLPRQFTFTMTILNGDEFFPVGSKNSAELKTP
jgi:hypothetical protein